MAIPGSANVPEQWAFGPRGKEVTPRGPKGGMNILFLLLHGMVKEFQEKQEAWPREDINC